MAPRTDLWRNQLTSRAMPRRLAPGGTIPMPLPGLLLFPLALGTVLATGMTMPVPAPLTLPAVNTHTRFSPPLGDKLGLKIT